MATVAADPFFAAHGKAARYHRYVPAGHAQGEDGRYLERHACETIMRRGQSQYVMRLLGAADSRPAPPDWSGFAAAFAAAGCVSLVLVGFGSGLADVLYPCAAVAGFAAYAFFARYVARRNKQSGFLGMAERIRRALAYQDDVVPRTK